MEPLRYIRLVSFALRPKRHFGGAAVMAERRAWGKDSRLTAGGSLIGHEAPLARFSLAGGGGTALRPPSLRCFGFLLPDFIVRCFFSWRAFRAAKLSGY